MLIELLKFTVISSLLQSLNFWHQSWKKRNKYIFTFVHKLINLSYRLHYYLQLFNSTSKANTTCGLLYLTCVSFHLSQWKVLNFFTCTWLIVRHILLVRYRPSTDNATYGQTYCQLIHFGYSATCLSIKKLIFLPFF